MSSPFTPDSTCVRAAATGREAWRSNTTAAPGTPGGDTWPGDTHRNGGGSIWITGTCDAATNLA